MSNPPYLASMSLADLVNVLKPITVPAKQTVFENWAGTFRCSPLSIFEPATERDLELIFELARREGRTVRAVGVGHSPSDLACTSGYMVRMNRMDAIVEVRPHIRLRRYAWLGTRGSGCRPPRRGTHLPHRHERLSRRNV